MEEHFSHESDCAEDTYWSSVALDEEFSRRLFIGVLEFESWDVLRYDDTELEIRRLIRGVPKLDERVPTAFRRFLKHGLAYRETDVYDKRTKRCQVVIVPKSISRRISINITFSTQPIGPDRCRCDFRINVIASIAVSLGGSSASGIGRMIEKQIIEHFMDGFTARAVLTNEFLAEKGLSTQTA